MNDIRVFKNPEFGSIRVVELDGDPWFVGKDVATVLGYSNSSKAVINHVDKEDKLIETSAYSQNGNTVGKLTFINESGLYSLILSSKLPTAKKFKRWVTSEVLPSIRKHGAYMTGETLEQALTSPDFLIKLATKLKDEQEKNKVLTADNERMKPKEIFTDAVTASDTSILVGDLAKLLRQNGIDIGQKRLFEWLRIQGYLIKYGNSRNVPTQYAMDLGLMELEEKVVRNDNEKYIVGKLTKVTSKGQVYFINKFLNEKQQPNYS